MTEYRLLRHRQSGQMWAVRVDGTEVTGVYGPLAEAPARAALAELPYDEDDTDTADWLVRYFEEFTTL